MRKNLCASCGENFAEPDESLCSECIARLENNPKSCLWEKDNSSRNNSKAKVPNKE